MERSRQACLEVGLPRKGVFGIDLAELAFAAAALRFFEERLRAVACRKVKSRGIAYAAVVPTHCFDALVIVTIAEETQRNRCCNEERTQPVAEWAGVYCATG